MMSYISFGLKKERASIAVDQLLYPYWEETCSRLTGGLNVHMVYTVEDRKGYGVMRESKIYDDEQ